MSKSWTWSSFSSSSSNLKLANVKVIAGEKKAVIGKEENRIFHHPHDKALLRRPTLIFVK